MEFSNILQMLPKIGVSSSSIVVAPRISKQKLGSCMIQVRLCGLRKRQLFTDWYDPHTATVVDIKRFLLQEFSHEVGDRIGQIHLIYAGSILRNGRTLHSYGIVHDTRIFVVIRSLKENQWIHQAITNVSDAESASESDSDSDSDDSDDDSDDDDTDDESSSDSDSDSDSDCAPARRIRALFRDHDEKANHDRCSPSCEWEGRIPAKDPQGVGAVLSKWSPSEAKEPCMITLEDDIERYSMPCGHSISVEGLNNFVTSGLKDGKTKLHCPGTKPDGAACNTEWVYPVIRTVAAWDLDQRDKIEESWASNTIRDLFDAQRCTECETWLYRLDLEDNFRICPACAKHPRIVKKKLKIEAEETTAKNRSWSKSNAFMQRFWNAFSTPTVVPLHKIDPSDLSIPDSLPDGFCWMCCNQWQSDILPPGRVPAPIPGTDTIPALAPDTQAHEILPHGVVLPPPRQIVLNDEMKYPQSERSYCGNVDCTTFVKKHALDILSQCVTKKIGSVDGVPEVRACPKCAQLITHVQYCKHMQCKCQERFCFVCMSRYKRDSGWTCGGSSTVCPIAPRQTCADLPRSFGKQTSTS